MLPWPTGVIILRNVNVPNVPIFFHHALDFFDSKHYSDGFQVFGIQYFVILMECLFTFRTARLIKWLMEQRVRIAFYLTS